MTMTLISTVTVGSGGASNIEFLSIPQTATDLLIEFSGRVTGGGYVWTAMYFNADTSAYSIRALIGTGSASSSQANSLSLAGLQVDGGATASTFSNNTIYIPNYTGSTHKSFSTDAVTEGDIVNTRQHIIAGLWSNTAAITSLKLQPYDATTYVEGTTASLYTITKGSGGATTTP